jgi:hypothetical protein
LIYRTKKRIFNIKDKIMAGALIGAGIQAAAGLVQGVHGIIQSNKGRKALENLDRPEYQIPDEILKNVDQAERMALQGMTETEKKEYVQRLQQNQAAQLSQMKTLGAGTRGLNQVNQAQQAGNISLLSMDEQKRQGNMLAATNQRSLYAQKLDEQWSVNKYQPYVQKYNQAQGLIGAGQQNLGEGLDSFTQSAANFASLGGFGGNTTTNPTTTSGSMFPLKSTSINMFR